MVLGERLSGLQWLAIACIVGACAGGAATGSRADAGAAQA
jgi:threonine/homoserine efflux transporter RhtA